jgi:DNA polymerase III subunit beta
MNITCKQENLLKAVSLLTQIISNKPQSRPILANVLLKVQDKKLELKATDLEMGLSVSVDLENCYEGGEILLPAHQFLGILKEASCSLIRLEVLERTAIVSGEHFQYKLPAYANEEFPEVPELEGEVRKVPTQIIQRILKEVAFAMNRDKNRFQLNSLLLCFNEDQIEGVATDQVRLAFSKSLMDERVEGEHKMILPYKSISVLNTILNDEKSEFIELISGESQVTFRFGHGFFIVRLVEAQFPNYRGAYENYTSVPDIIVDTQRLNQAIRQMILLTCENAKNIMLILESGSLTLKVSTPLGEGQSEIQVDYSGESMAVGMNPYFVQEFLREIASQGIENIRMKVVGPRKPIIMSPHDDYIYFMSPISS